MLQNSIYPFCLCLSGSGSWGQLFQQGSPDCPRLILFPRLQRWASHPHREMWSLQHVPGQPWALLLHGTPMINCSTLLLLHTFRAPPPAGHCRGTYLYMFIRSVKNINTPSGFDEGDCSSLSRTLPHWQTDTLGQPQGGVCHEVRNNQSISVWFIIPWTPDIDMDW